MKKLLLLLAVFGFLISSCKEEIPIKYEFSGKWAILAPVYTNSCTMDSIGFIDFERNTWRTNTLMCEVSKGMAGELYWYSCRDTLNVISTQGPSVCVYRINDDKDFHYYYYPFLIEKESDTRYKLVWLFNLCVHSKADIWYNDYYILEKR